MKNIEAQSIIPRPVGLLSKLKKTGERQKRNHKD
jgi:hypothetical protein